MELTELNNTSIFNSPLCVSWSEMKADILSFSRATIEAHREAPATQIALNTQPKVMAETPNRVLE